MNVALNNFVSIIVPIYHGKKYIPKLVGMAEMCKERAGSQVKIELILSNDDPDERIEETLFSDTIDILVLNTKVNRGIQGARIRGLKAGKGEYVVFLDQDDILYPDYVSSQMLHIKDADAVVCRCIHENKQFYNADRKFEDVVKKEYMMENGNPIISAGQVLVRRSSIPAVWLDNVMRTNCADDYLLWLCMAAQGAGFALNQNILFEHVVNGENLSLDSRREILSLDEMCGILSRNKVFGEQGMQKIMNMRQKVLFERIGLLEKFREMFLVLNKMAECREKGCPIVKHLALDRILRVAIYGDGYIGKRLMGELKEHHIETVFFIDKNADYITEEIPVYRLEDAPEDIDAVLVSLVQNCDSIVEILKKKYKAKIYTVKELMSV